MNFKNTTLILPTLNEKDSLPLLLKMVLGLYQEIKIIIVDDGSNDGTKELALKYSKEKNNIFFLDRSKEKIHGICISTIEAIKKTKTKYFILMDADMQHPPEKIKEIIKTLTNNHKIVIGTRKKVKHWKIQRKLMSFVATHLAKICLFLHNKKIPKDPLSGFFGGDTIFFQSLINKNLSIFELKGYKPLFDFLKVLPRKTKIKEIFYIFGERKIGQSKIKTKHIFYFLKSLFK